MRREQSHAVDVRVFDATAEPRTTGEIVMLLKHEVWNAWAEENDVELEYDERGLAQPPLARLLAYSRSLREDPVKLNHAQVYNRLLKLEKLGVIRRLMMPSHSRSILWMRTEGA
jgi:hypothetical protein